MAKTFEGMAHPDTYPLEIRAADVKRVHMFDVPASLREHAHYMLSDMSGDVWWTLGEFRYAGESEYDTAVCRRVGATVEYGIES